MKISLYTFGSDTPIKSFNTILEAKKEAEEIPFGKCCYFVLEDFDGTMMSVDLIQIKNAFNK